MNRLIEKPHLAFLYAIPVIMLIGILSNGSADFNIHATYFIIDHLYLAIAISMVFVIIGAGYWLMQKFKLSKWLNRIHMILTFGGICTAWILTKLHNVINTEHSFNDNTTTIVLLVVLLTLAGQLIFPINIIYGFINKKKKG
ncbi:hypothetical protein PW52_02455 [Tamlana sedimentorum]|uniref:DUF2231 domain-containing protein n=1 Tax=Neotamlana sedimentorum TaxID=1435349 RepID=A0A0D7WFL1_9FLAO|nr:hypothetical protein [Tamlana sedimentorum]KJD36532.1 hypothetical protein PW52_02455 [Tamlana sedimentorum]